MTTYLRRNQASLYLGLLLCTGQTTDLAGNMFTIKAMAAGASWGSAQPVDIAVQRWMTDGAVAVTQGYENRTITFQVKISATTSAALAAGETALVQAATGPTTITWVPPEGSPLAAATVFDVWLVHLEHQMDIDEDNRLTRSYVVTATAKPWARSEDLITVPANTVGGTPTTVSVDTCTSLTGWTGTPNTPTVTGGTAILESKSSPDGRDLATLSLTRTGSVTGMGTTPYLAIDTRFFAPNNTINGTQVLSHVVTVDGLACTRAGQNGTVYYWKVPAAVTSFTTLKITAYLKKNASFNTGTDTINLNVYDVTRTNVISGIGSQKMLTRHLDVGGSVKTSGSIQLSSPSASALGAVLVYTCPDTGSGYVPPLRVYRTSGNTVTTDATCVSGKRELFANTIATTSPILYSVPNGFLQEGTYVVVARFTSSGSATFLPKFSTLDTASNIVDSTSRNASIGPSGVAWMVIGSVSIPATSRPPESTQPVLLRFEQTPGLSSTGSDVNLDEVFILDVTHGAFSLLLLNVSSGYTQTWLDSPDADPILNRPAVYVGTTADRSDAARPDYSQIISLGDHDFDPNGTTVFTVTGNVDNAAASATFYRRWHTHAAA